MDGEGRRPSRDFWPDACAGLSHDSKAGAGGVRQAQGGDGEGGVGAGGAKGDEEDLVLVVLEEGVEVGLKLAQVGVVEEAFEDGVFEAVAVAFEEFGGAAEAAGVADVVADEVAGAAHAEWRVCEQCCEMEARDLWLRYEGQAMDVVRRESFVCREEGKFVGDGRRDEHAVEGVSVFFNLWQFVEGGGC